MTRKLTWESVAQVISIAAEDHLLISIDKGAYRDGCRVDFQDLGDHIDVRVQVELQELDRADTVSRVVKSNAEEVGLTLIDDLENHPIDLREGGFSGFLGHIAIADNGGLILPLHSLFHQLLGLVSQENGRSDALDVGTARKLQRSPALHHGGERIELGSKVGADDFRVLSPNILGWLEKP